MSGPLPGGSYDSARILLIVVLSLAVVVVVIPIVFIAAIMLKLGT